MCCLVTTLFLLGPRVAIVLWWLVQPVRWQVAFHNVFIWPVLGFLLLPWTTLAYVFAAPTGTLNSATAYAIVAIGFVIDLIGWSSGYGNRGRVRDYAR
jgi:hypothetical protein